MRRVPDPRADDRDARAGLGNRDDGAVLRDHLDDELSPASVRSVDVHVAVELLELHLRNDARRDRAPLLHLEARRVVHAGERRAAAAVRGRGRPACGRTTSRSRASSDGDDERDLEARHMCSVAALASRRKTLFQPCLVVYSLPERAMLVTWSPCLLIRRKRSTHGCSTSTTSRGSTSRTRSCSRRTKRARVVEAVTPDFYLPTVGAYVECTTTKPHLMSRKRRKARKLRDKYGHIVTLLERDDLERLLQRRSRWSPFRRNLR